MCRYRSRDLLELAADTPPDPGIRHAGQRLLRTEQRPLDPEHDRDPDLVLRRPRDRLVELDVDLGQRSPLHVVDRRELDEAPGELLEVRAVLLVGALGGPARGLRLEADAELRQLVRRRAAEAEERVERGPDLVALRLADERAAGRTRADLDRAERLERPEALAQRRPADAEEAAELTLVGQALPRDELLRDDRLADLRDDVVGRALALDLDEKRVARRAVSTPSPDIGLTNLSTPIYTRSAIRITNRDIYRPKIPVILRRRRPGRRCRCRS